MRTSNLRGEAFYYDREKALTSPGAFGRTLNNQQGQFGGAVASLKHDRAFLLARWNGSLLKVPYVVQFDPQAAGVAVPADLLGLQGEQRATNNPTAVFGRSDVVVGSGLLNLQGTYTRLHGENFNFDTLQLNQAVTTNFMRESKSIGGKVGLTSVFGPGVLNEVRGQVATDDRDELPNARTALVTITGFGNIGGDSGRPRAYHTTRFEAADQVNLTWGVHRVRVGFDYNVNDVGQEREDNRQGRYDFKSLADFMARKISRYRQTVLVFNPADAFFTGRQTEAAAHVQDKLALGDVTVTAGLRWEGQWNHSPQANPAIATPPFRDLKQWQPRVGVCGPSAAPARPSCASREACASARTPRLCSSGSLPTTASPRSRSQQVRPGRSERVDVYYRSPACRRCTVAAPRCSVSSDFRAAVLAGFGDRGQLIGEDVTLSVGYTLNATHSLQRRLDRNLFAPQSTRGRADLSDNARTRRSGPVDQRIDARSRYVRSPCKPPTG